MAQYDPNVHNRRSIRLKGYDYAQPGAYFVTIVAQGRECLFGNIVDGEMRLNDAGRMTERWWVELGNKYPHIIPDARIVMPNHFHGIVIITDEHRPHVGADPRVGADLCVCPDTNTGMGAHAGNQGADVGNQGAHAGAPLPEIVQWFKTMTTNEYVRGVKTLEWTPFPGKLWQRNYYDHIIRNDRELWAIQEYIANNPVQWAVDRENPYHNDARPGRDKGVYR